MKNARKSGNIVTNKHMFFIMLIGSIMRRLGKSLMAITAALVGSATLFCLTAICLSVPQQINEDLRAYGANMIVTPRDSSRGIDHAQIMQVTHMLSKFGVLRYASYRYENVRINSLPYVLAGIHSQQVHALNHHWDVDGQWPSKDSIMVGQNVADKLGLQIGSRIKIAYRASDNGKADISRSLSLGSAHPITLPNGSQVDSSDLKHHHHHHGDMQADNFSNITDQKPKNSMENMHMDMHSGHGHMDGEQMDGSHMQGDEHMQMQDHHDHSSMAQGATAASNGAMDHSAMDQHGMNMDNSSNSGNSTHTNAPQQSQLKGLEGRTSTNILDNSGVEFRVSGIVSTGGNEDDLVYASLPDVVRLSGTVRGSDVIECSLNASEPMLKKALKDVMKDKPLALQAQQVAKITSADTRIITMLQTLFWIVSIVVLGLTLVGVGTTIFSIVAGRRNEIGLRKALGASSHSIAQEFYTASALYGLVGGIVGTAVGYACAYWLCIFVFHRDVGAHPWLVIISVLVSILISVAASIMPVRVATRIDPAIVLREE